MKDRFKMNRIGFVNFWLYDEEEFEFVDGKLLLRGQNASGKSITTQSFIPFIWTVTVRRAGWIPLGPATGEWNIISWGKKGRMNPQDIYFWNSKKRGRKNIAPLPLDRGQKKENPWTFGVLLFWTGEGLAMI